MAMRTTAARNSHSGVRMAENRPEPAGMSVANSRRARQITAASLRALIRLLMLLVMIACLIDAERFPVFHRQPHRFHLAIAKDMPSRARSQLSTTFRGPHLV